MMFTLLFWKDLGERAISTFAENAVSILIVAGAGLFDTDWKNVLSVAGMAALLAALKGIGAQYVGDPNSASLVPGLTVHHGRHESP